MNRKIKQTILYISIAFVLGVCVSILGYLVIRQNKVRMYTGQQEAMASVKESEEVQHIDAVFRELDMSIHESIPGIVCWGDSLTAGAGGEGYTYEDTLHDLIQENVLSQFNWNKFVDDSHKYLLDTIPEGYEQNYSALPDISVVNMGVGGEGTKTIMARAGAIPFVVAEDMVIPATSYKVTEIKIQYQDGSTATPLLQGDAGMRSVTIAGVKGTIKICQESHVSPEYAYYFLRESYGEEVPVEAGTVIYTDGSEDYTDYLPVIFMGQNGGWDDNPQVLIEQQKAMLNHQSKNNDRFIIIGLHTGTAVERKALEDAMVAEWGNKYINLRKYMSGEAIEDAGIEPTERDLEMMDEGMTVESFLAPDGVHFNKLGYQVIGKKLYARMNELGYFDGVKEAIGRINAEA